MEIDLVFPPREQVHAGNAAARAEQAGYDAIWAGEIMHDPFVTLALAAARTEHTRLGTAIALALARNPMSMAVLANDLQAASAGRFSLGLGTQVRAHITRRFAMPWSAPAARMREYVLALRAIWTCWHDGAPLDFEGEFYQHTLMPPTFVPEAHPYGAPQVLLAGVGQTMTEVAGEVADGFLCHAFTTDRYIREVTLPALRRGRSKAEGTTSQPTVIGGPLLVTGRTEEELSSRLEQVRGQIAFYASTPAYRPVLELHGWGDLGDELHGMSREGRWAEMTDRIDASVLDMFAIVGEPAYVGRELVRRYAGVLTRVTLQLPDGGDPSVVDEVAEAARAAQLTGSDRSPTF